MISGPYASRRARRRQRQNSEIKEFARKKGKGIVKPVLGKVGITKIKSKSVNDE